MTVQLPDMLPGHWETPDGAAMARDYADKPREWLMGSKYTDMQAAHEIAMTGRGDLMFEGKLQMAKHRIRWLSVQLACRLQEIQVWAEIQLRDRARLREMEPTVKAARKLATLMMPFVDEKAGVRQCRFCSELDGRHAHVGGRIGACPVGELEAALKAMHDHG